MSTFEIDLAGIDVDLSGLDSGLAPAKTPGQVKAEIDKGIDVTLVTVDGVKVAETRKIDIAPVKTRKGGRPRNIEVVAPESPAVPFTPVELLSFDGSVETNQWIVTDAKALQNALAVLKPIVGLRSAVKALSCVQITADSDGILVAATDMECTARRRLAFDARGGGEIDVIVSFAELVKAVRAAAGGQVMLEAQPSSTGRGALLIKNTKRTVTLQEGNRQDWPPLPAEQGASVALMAGEDFADRLGFVLVAASKDESRPILCGVNVEVSGTTVTLVGTDSYRLHVDELACQGASRAQDVLIPARLLRAAVKDIRASEDVQLTHYGHFASIQTAGGSWTARVIEGKFPDYRALVPDYWEVTVTLDGQDLLSAVRTAGEFALLNSPLALSLQPQDTEITVENKPIDGGAHVREGVQLTQRLGIEQELVVGLNPDFFADGLAAIGAGELAVHFISPLRPVSVTRQEPGSASRVLLMPIRLNV